MLTREDHKKKDGLKVAGTRVSTELQGGSGCGSAPTSHQELFHMCRRALKTLEQSCSVVKAQTFKYIQRTP